jgi:hypothetical protein
MNSVEEDERRAVARRLFEALCALYPDRYVALSEPNAARDRPSPTTVTAVKAPTPVFQRIWPFSALAFAALINLAWIGLLGLGIFKLFEPAFLWIVS